MIDENDPQKEVPSVTAELLQDTVTLRMPRRPWTFEDLLDTPDDGRRWEIVDGSLHVSPSPTLDHQLVSFRLAQWLSAAAPDGYVAVGPVNLVCGDSVLEPDVNVVRYEVGRGRVLKVPPGDVLLAVEVVSPSSRRMDRWTKPSIFAEAGIPAYWRVELDGPDTPVVAVHGLVDGGYSEVATVRAGEERLVTVPFPVLVRPAELVGPRQVG
jgi:Uma2 family endonuclease